MNETRELQMPDLVQEHAGHNIVDYIIISIFGLLIFMAGLGLGVLIGTGGN